MIEPIENRALTDEDIINSSENKNNKKAIVGFIVSIFGLLVGWIPVLGWIVWLVGLVFSIIGFTKKPKGFAIAGLVISIISLIIISLVFGGLALISSWVYLSSNGGQ